MPRDASFLDERPMVGGNYEITWPRLTGRQIFDSRTISGLNRIPVIIHSSYIVGQAQMPDGAVLPFSIDKLTESLIVDGTIVILKPDPKKNPDTPVEFLTNILEATPSYVVQELEQLTGDGQRVVREWRKITDGWKYSDWTNYKRTNQEQIASGTISADRIYIFVNGNGILAPAYDTMYRLEEIRLRVRKGSNAAITMIVTGFTGDFRQAQEVFGDEDLDKIAVPKSATVEFMSTTAAVDQFLLDSKDLLPNYWKLTRLIEVSDSSKISGIARRLIMQPMLQYITSNQKKIVKIYRDWGFDIEFDTIPTMTVDERAGEFALLKSLRDSGAITPEQFKEKAARLA